MISKAASRDVRYCHEKTERAEDQANFIFAQQELKIKVDRHKIKEHPFAETPKEQGGGDKK